MDRDYIHDPFFVLVGTELLQNHKRRTYILRPNCAPIALRTSFEVRSWPRVPFS